MFQHLSIIIVFFQNIRYIIILVIHVYRLQYIKKKNLNIIMLDRLLGKLHKEYLHYVKSSVNVT